jgi:hypothetical protein
MSKDNHIDNISEKVWKAYFSGVILTSEKERVEAFLKQYPEFEEEFNTISSADVKSISKITNRINSRIVAKYSTKKSPVLWIGMVATIAIIAIVLFNNQDKAVNEVANGNAKEESIVAVDSTETQVAITDQINAEELIDDTIFFFERKGSDIEVEELLVVVENINTLEDIGQENERDSVIILDKPEELNEIQKPVYQKRFITSIDYRQTAHVEDNFYSQSKTMGKTSSYASPINGYSYEMEGMPNFNGSDEALLSYINSELSSDELINGIRRTMKASLSFVVTNKGKIKDVLVQNCNHRQFGMSIMQIMENMPDWSSSDFKGKKGKVHYVLKIVFE